jgi:hypothetical protein
MKSFSNSRNLFCKIVDYNLILDNDRGLFVKLAISLEI